MTKENQFKIGNKFGKGRPKGKTITTQLREALNSKSFVKQLLKNSSKKIKQSFEGKTAQELLIIRLSQLAIDKGDIKAIQLIMNYVDGAPKQTLAVEDKRELTKEEADELQEVNKIMYGETNVKKEKRITEKTK